MIRALAGLLGLLCLAAAPQADAASCRQALALALDVSGSVDDREYRLQLDGLARALRDETVQDAFLRPALPPVRLLIYEWSGPHHQREILAWQTITSTRQLHDIADQLNATASVKINDPSTAITPALLFGAAALSRHGDCWRHTLDISGDGPANIGRHPGDLGHNDLHGITINALVIGPDNRSNTTKNLNNIKSLEQYFRSFVLRGPGAFVETALDHADFSRAMRRKLIRELDVPAVSQRAFRPGTQIR